MRLPQTIRPSTPIPSLVMKRFFSFVLPILLLSPLLKADILTVDNNGGSIAMYTSLATAIAAASPGDTLLIAGSPNHYGDHHLYKPLHFVGVGYFLTSNNIPGLSKNATNVHLRFKKDNSLGDSSGSSSTGTSGLIESVAGVTGIVIDKCQSPSWNWDFYGSTTVTRSYNQHAVQFRTSNSSISNSVIGNLQLHVSNLSATNCVVRGTLGAATGTNVTNTIFTITSGASLSSNPTYTFCLNIGASLLPAGNGNINGKLLPEVLTAIGSVNEDRYFQLNEGSAAAGTGLSGDDMGVFGGSNPYVLGGVPGIPRMTRFNGPETATGLSVVTIEVEAEAFAE
ncbi:MAG: hypothetical protein ACI92G_001222 [Candidatus Pelagisphaera sp.]|jgi:hypothetical protein